MKTILLNGQFKMSTADKKFICNANIPGSDFGNLINNGLVKNPLNTSSQEEFDNIIAPIERSDYCFERGFELEASDLDFANIHLNCDKIDTLCKIYINQQLAFEGNNTHIAVDTDIKPFVKIGKNTIKICIDSAVNYIFKKQEAHKLPKNSNGYDGAAYIRKAACHFGWDWGPCVAYKYIGNIEINCYNRKFDNLAIKQKIEQGVATVTVTADNADKISLISPSGKKIKPNGNDFVIEQPELWYTSDLNNCATQPLYTLVLENDEMKTEHKIGIRQVELNQGADEFGNNFQLLINGKRIFAKGANLIPFSAIPEFYDNSTIDYYLDLAVKSNFNIIRVWGGAEYASEYLLKRCDELGILIWQDFCFACLMYPFYDKQFAQNVLNEVDYNVKRMQLHPCLALWCGNNEIEAMFSYLPKTSDLVKSYTEFFYTTLPEFIKGKTTAPYIPTSPIGNKPFSKNTADEVGDTHMWNVWHGLKPLNYYEKRYTRFLSEFGLESLPSMRAIKTFATEKDFDLSSAAFMSHQKCVGGNKKMLFYLGERFNMPKHFEDLPYLTGIVQAECVESATLHFRRNKGRCNGSIFWQFNDVWNCPSWSGVDYEGVPKAVMYKAKSFFAPITVSYHKGWLYAHNDTMQNKKIVFNINGKQIYTELAADSVQLLTDIDLNNKAVSVKWGNDEIIFDGIKKLSPAKIEVKIDSNKMVLKADTYARNVFVESNALSSDNYFNLLPNEPKIITFAKPIDTYTISCENNVEFENAPIKKGISRFVYRLKPMNIANAFYYEYN